MIVDARISPLGRVYAKSAINAARRARAAFEAGNCRGAFVWHALAVGAVQKDEVRGEEGRAARKLVGALQEDLSRVCLLPRAAHPPEPSRMRLRAADRASSR